MSDSSVVPAYRKLLGNGDLERRATQAFEAMQDCVLCGRQCHVNRLQRLRGSVCGTGERALVASYGPHRGEEAPLSGTAGSGTIFFAKCNLSCVYCQNWEISQKGRGDELDAEELAGVMLNLQEQGCHNINLVSPSHVVGQILCALTFAADQGLRLPLVFNSGGYDSLEALELLEGVIDIYMPDLKYGSSREARLYSHVRNYASVNRKAVKEMHRQVGDLVVDENGIAQRGLLVRHLVLPGGLANTGRVLKFIAEEISPNTYVNLMDQYYPAYKAFDHAPLDRPVTAAEYRRALGLARKHGIRRLDEVYAKA